MFLLPFLFFHSNYIFPPMLSNRKQKGTDTAINKNLSGLVAVLCFIQNLAFKV